MALDNIKLSQLKKIVGVLEKQYPDDTEISFEFLIGSFYPHVLENIQETLRKEHTKGYIQAMNELKEKE